MASTARYNSVVSTLNRPLPTWVSDADDAVRVAAYDAYQDMYDNVPQTFKLIMRGVEDQPIYIPSSRRIVEATNRYLGKDFSWSVTVPGTQAQPGVEQQDTVSVALTALLRREEFQTKFYSLKRNFLLKGDGVFHIMANMALPAGQRVSIVELDPRYCFRIPDKVSEEETVGWYITDLITVGVNKTVTARRLQYQLIKDADEQAAFGVPIGNVFARLTFWDPTGWDDRFAGHPALKPAPIPEEYAADAGMQPLLNGMALDPRITALPIYHARNNRRGSEPWGTSEVSGMETLIAGINQSVSDEDITLALQGLGIYVTTAKRPVDENGDEMDWSVGPAQVLELQNATDKFERVDGLNNLAPFQQHMEYLGKKLDESSGLSAVAVGNVDVQVAQSGVALRLDMAPILAKNEEKETELLSKMDQMFHDIATMWMLLEEVQVPDGVVVDVSFGDPLPADRAAAIAEVTTLVAAGLMSKAFAISYLNETLGFNFPPDMLDQLAAEQDATAARMAGELAGAGGTVNMTGQMTGVSGGGAGAA